MKKSILIVAVVAIVVIVVAGVYVGYSGVLNAPADNPTPAPEAPTQETVRDSTMTYIAENHDLASMTADLTWTGGLQETDLVGSVTYIYTAGNWEVTITNPVVADPTYTVSAVYTDTESMVTIEWAGTYQNGEVAETSFDYIVP